MSRIGGIFPFPFETPQTGDGTYSLAGGGVYVPPAGDWQVVCDANTQLQWFNPNTLVWQPSTAGAAFQQVSTDPANFRIINTTGTVTGTTITGAGTGATNGIGTTATGVTLVFTASPVGAIATAVAFPIVGGSVQAPTITQGGSGFLAPPLIMIDPPPAGGIQATAVATISSAGVVTAITMVKVGAGYTSSPNFYVIPQPPYYTGSPIAGVAAAGWPAAGLVYPTNLPGNAFSFFEPNKSPVGCQLTPAALTGSGTLTGIGIIDAGFAYTATPTITVLGAGAATATAAAVVSTTTATFTMQGRVQ
jgi:hypothetical protein